MSSLLTSQGLVLAAAMAVSAGTVILFDLLRERYFPGKSNNNQDYQSIPDPKRVLKSCLSSGNRQSSDKEQEQHQTKEGEKKKKKKKRVQFADEVKGSGEFMCRNPSSRAFDECYKMPANRLALYSGILRDRVQRMEHSC